jgi:hypothetical protein
MRKSYAFGLALMAIFSMGAIISSAASAEVALWLHNGADITTGTLATQSTGLLELTDLGATGGAVTVNCDGILDGWVGPEGLDEISEVLTLGGVKNTENLIECEVVTGKEGACQTSMLANVIPKGLPWLSQLELMATGAEEYLDVVTSAAPKFGYKVICLTILGETPDECLQETATQTLKNVTGGVEGVSKEEETGTCTIGGKKGDISGSGLTTLNNGETLTVSMP